MVSLAYLSSLGALSSLAVRGAPLPAEHAQAVQALWQDFPTFDTAAHGGKADSTISTNDLKAIRKRPSATKAQKGAAAYFLQHHDAFTQLDTAALGGWSDGKISFNDIEQFANSQRIALPQTTLPQPQENAWETLNTDFERFDTAAQGGAAQGGAGDGKISREDLQAVRDGSGYSAPQRAAARYLLDTPSALSRIDSASRDGTSDGTISRNDITTFALHHTSLLPLLGSTSVEGSDTNPTTLHITAQAPQGASWRNATNRSGIVSVYVDGKYYSDATVFAENPDGVDVNLGMLGAGQHTIELRDSSTAGTGYTARLEKSSVEISTSELNATSTDPSMRDQALAAKYAPVVHQIDNSQAGNNTPLYTQAKITHNEDGSERIQYRLLLTNEDGGDATDPRREAGRWGRETDDELAYTVTVNAQGEMTGFTHSGASKMLGGEWQKNWDQNNVNGHPQLVIIDAHNHFGWASEHPYRSQNRAFSGTPLVVSGETTLDVMNSHPWTWKVSVAEARRETYKDESKYDRAQLGQRIYLNLHGAPHGDVTGNDVAGVTLRLKNGSWINAPLDTHAKGTPSQTLSLVPPKGVSPRDITTVDVSGLPQGATAQAQYLGENDQPVLLPTT